MQKGRFVIPDKVEKRHVGIAKSMIDKNMDGMVTKVNLDEYNNGEDFIVVFGQGFTVGYVPKEWVVLERKKNEC